MMSTRSLSFALPMKPTLLSPRLARNRSLLRTTLGKRSIETESLPPPPSVDILNEQRLKRPMSPHLSIYKSQLTSVLSITNRGVGVALGVLLYGFSVSFLAAPEIFAGPQIVELAGSLPDAAKYAGKALLAAPFAYHALSGVRHLAWDVGKFMTIPGVYRTGYAVLVGTAVSTVALVLL
ncbi:SDHC, cytochrome b subunit of succinate dehydrogenase [Mycena polygramma]|nr:SDHC, cytochrome b subunit of succinate dehydrogenase [Mycena polygramma]